MLSNKILKKRIVSETCEFQSFCDCNTEDNCDSNFFEYLSK